MDVIVCHVNADFDSLGGLVGGARLYPGAAMVLPGGASAGVRSFLALHAGVLNVRPPEEVEPEAITRVIVVDTPSRARLGKVAGWLDLPEVEVHLYDHHTDAECDIPAAMRWIQRVGSVSAILARLLEERGETPTPIEATALLLGIYEDTGSLSYGGTTPEDLEAAAWLLRSGGDLDVVAEHIRHALTPDQRRLLHRALAASEVREIRGIPLALSVLPPGPYVEGAAGLVNRLMEAEEAEAGLLIAPMDEAIYVIARSRTDALDVGAALREIGGGGHPRAASATLKEADAQGVLQQVLQALEQHAAPERTARELMSHPVRTIPADATVSEARARMIRYGHSGLVVTEDGRIAGILSRRDVDRARHHRLDHSPVRAFMTADVHAVGPDAPLSELEETMIRERIGRLPVVRGDELLGIVTRHDVLRALHGSRYLTGVRREGEEPMVRLLREQLPARAQRLLEQVGRTAAREDCEAYLVGGIVRDLLLGVRNLEIDLLVEPDGIALARAVARDLGEDAVELKVHGAFGTAKLKLSDGMELDFATARTEHYTHPGALPEVEVSSIGDDLRRRDFTFNAMAVAIRPERFGELLDPFGGRADLERRRVRVLHALSFVEDPTRLFRAVRFEERFHFRMDPHTEALARRMVEAGGLVRISPERLRQEIGRVLKEKRPLGSLRRLEELGVFRWLDPDLELDQELLKTVPGALEWWKSTGGETVDGRLVYLGALLAPLGAERAATVTGERFRLSPADVERLRLAVEALARKDALLADRRPSEATGRLRTLPVEALVLLRAATGGEEHEARRGLLERYVSDWRHTRLEITGNDLQAAGIRPGPAMGNALRKTLDARLDGEVSGSESELSHALRLLQGTLPSEEPPRTGGPGRNE